MVDGLGVHRLNDGDVVGHAANVRQSLVHPCAVLAHALEFKHRSDTGERFLAAGHGGQPLAVADGFREFFAMEIAHCRFVIEHVDMAWAARVKQHNDTLGFRGKVGHAG